MIICIGVGPGDIDYLTERGRRLIADADVVAGFTAVNDVAAAVLPPGAERVDLTYANQVEKLASVARRHAEGKKCVVLLMGDPHFSGFQLVERVERACGEPVETVPGISSAQILASKARVCFDETSLVTFHRRGDLAPFKGFLVHSLQAGRNAIVIPRPYDFMPRDVAAFLIEQGVSPHHPTQVWENLTQNEAQWSGALEACTLEFSDMSIVLIRTMKPMPSQIDVFS